MNQYFSFSKYIYYNYEVDDKLSPQKIENSDDKNKSYDKIKEINIINENNNDTQNQINTNKNEYYYVYCHRKKIFLKLHVISMKIIKFATIIDICSIVLIII